MRYRYAIFLLLLTSALKAQKQRNVVIDSMLRTIPSAANDTVKVRIYNRAANYYADVNTDSALLYAAKGMRVAEQIHWQKGISAFHTCYGNIFSNLGLLDSSMRRYQQALGICIALKDTVNMAVNYNNLGGVANAKSDFVSAALFFSATLQLGESSKNSYSIGLACENLALVYYNQKDYNRSLAYARQSLAAYETGNHDELKQSALKAIANAFRNMKQYDSANVHYQKALWQCRQNNNKMNEASTLDAMAQLYADQEIYETALQYSMEARKIWDVTSPDFEDAINNKGYIGVYYLQIAKRSKPFAAGNQQSASSLLKQAQTFLSTAIKNNNAAGNKVAVLEFQRSLAEVYAMQGNYKEAYLNVIQYQEKSDSIYSQENKNKIAAAISRLEIDKKNDEIIISKLTIAHQRRQIFYYTSGLLLLSLIGYLFYRQSRMRKKTNAALSLLNTQLEEANKLKSRFFAILSHDLRMPVASLISFLQLQKNEPGMMSEQQAMDNQQRITASAEALLGNMEAMLLWSKGQMENFKPVMKNISVKELFIYIKDYFAATKNVTFVFNNPENIEIYSDENYLHAIMHNLTANAVKAISNTTDAQITWTAAKEGQNIHLSISDNGPGMKPADVNAFYADEPVANKKYGLGLYLVKELAKAINCKISCDTSPVKGTAFILSC